MAEPALIQAYALNEKDVEAATGLAGILMAQNHYPEAFQLLKTAVAQNPRSVPAQMSLGRLYRKKASYLHASEAFNAVVQADRNVPEAWYELAVCYLETQRIAQAQEAIAQALRLVPSEPNYLALKGSIEVALGNVEAGIAATRQAAQLAPASLHIQSNYLTILLTNHRNKEDLDSAEQVIGIVEQISPDNPLLPFEHGELERLRGHWPQAARFLERGLQTAPQHDQTYYSLSQVYLRLKRASDAARMLAIFRARENAQRQIGEIRVALEARPNDVALYARLADLQLQSGDVAGAMDSLKLAIGIDPTQSVLKARLARLQSETGGPSQGTP